MGIVNLIIKILYWMDSQPSSYTFMFWVRFVLCNCTDLTQMSPGSKKRHDYELICMEFRIFEHYYDWIKKHLHGVELIGFSLRQVREGVGGGRLRGEEASSSMGTISFVWAFIFLTWVALLPSLYISVCAHHLECRHHHNPFAHVDGPPCNCNVWACCGHGIGAAMGGCGCLDAWWLYCTSRKSWPSNKITSWTWPSLPCSLCFPVSAGANISLGFTLVDHRGEQKGGGSKKIKQKSIDDLINEFWYFALLVIVIWYFLGSIFHVDAE